MSHQNEKTVRNTIEILKHNLIDALGEDAYVIGPTATFYPASGKTYNETLIVRYKNYFQNKASFIANIVHLKQSSLYVHINVDPCGYLERNEVMVIIKIYSQDVYVAAEISVKHAAEIAEVLDLQKEDIFIIGSDGAFNC